MNDSDKKRLKILIPIVFIVGLSGVLFMLYKKHKLKNANTTTAIVVSVGAQSSYDVIHYKYKVEYKAYSGSESIRSEERRMVSSEELEQIKGLKIKYSIDSPWISEIIDERIK
jgi:hypothetical protein